MNNSVSVVIPALNEDQTLEKVTVNLDAFLKKGGFDYEIIIVDDGSTDKTGQIADQLMSQNERVRTLHNTKNMGFGYAFKRGIENASKTWATLVTADDEVEIEDIPLFLPHAEKSDIIIGYINNKWIRSRMRRFLSWGFRTTVRILFKMNFEGINGMPFYRVSEVNKLDIMSDDFSIQAEILVKGAKKGLRVGKFGYRIKPRLAGEAKATQPKHIWRALVSTMKLWQDIKK
ncbi:glycosyltransferase family 2 protein [Patescibacteria group bacterium]